MEKRIPKMRHNYEETAGIGYEVGLRGHRLILFTRYMMERGFNNSHDSYVREWAHRFLAKDEWNTSDGDGQRVLKKLNNKLERFSRGEYE